MEKFLEENKGVIIFYAIIALLAFGCSCRLKSLNIISHQNEITVENKHYA